MGENKAAKSKLRATICVLVIVICAGLALRLAACFQGYPAHYHCDEPTIVENSIDMIRRQSYEANVYNRPDHFEIKCNVVLFQIFSYAKYHVSAAEAFEEHEIDFYLIARGYTAFFGALMILLAYLLLEKLKPGAGLFGAILTAFCLIFVRHSAYATPDIVLTAVIMLITYASILYLEKPSLKKLICISILAAIGITIKYTCAISCLWIAFLVMFEYLPRKEHKYIVKCGLIAALTVLCVTFLLAPNLYTNLITTLYTILQEARPTHLGGDGLGPFGNFIYYLKTFLVRTNVLCLPWLLLGVICVIVKRKRSGIALGFGLLLWICTSALPLHWERWGIPFYIFFIFAIAIGMRWGFDVVKQKLRCATGKRALFRCIQVVMVCSVCLIFLNEFVSSLSDDVFALSIDTRQIAQAYCSDHGITEENSIYDGYTPFCVRKPATVPVALNDAGLIELSQEQAGVSYIIVSSAMYDRYYRERERYAATVALYDAVAAQCRLLCQIEPNSGKTSGWILTNIIYRIQYMLSHKENDYYGPTIRIYEIVKQPSQP